MKLHCSMIGPTLPEETDSSRGLVGCVDGCSSGLRKVPARDLQEDGCSRIVRLRFHTNIQGDPCLDRTLLKTQAGLKTRPSLQQPIAKQWATVARPKQNLDGTRPPHCTRPSCHKRDCLWSGKKRTNASFFNSAGEIAAFSPNFMPDLTIGNAVNMVEPLKRTVRMPPARCSTVEPFPNRQRFSKKQSIADREEVAQMPELDLSIHIEVVQR